MNPSIRSSLLTKVIFRLEVEKLSPEQTVFLIGDAPQVGSWSPSSAVKMSLKNIPSRPSTSVWEARVDLVTGMVINYKYLIIGRDRRIKWESSKDEFRTITPQGLEMIVQDGAFGRDTDEVWVDEGWLNSEVQVRIEMGHIDSFDGSYIPPLTGMDDSRAMSLHFFDANSYLSRDVIQLPLQDSWTEVVFHMAELSKLKITVEVYDRSQVDPDKRFVGESQSSNEWQRLGRTSINASLLKERRGQASVPIFNQQLEHVGTLNFKYLVVTPFKHPLNNLSSIWKSYTKASKPIGMAVGHRGCGSTRTTVISENTILSFLTAADYGADYVEFDVQITKEGVPVINHDFHLPVHTATGNTLNVPLSSLTKREFKSLRPANASESPLAAVLQKYPTIKRSKSMTNLKSLPSQKLASNGSSSSDEQAPNLEVASNISESPVGFEVQKPKLLPTIPSIDSLDLLDYDSKAALDSLRTVSSFESELSDFRTHIPNIQNGEQHVPNPTTAAQPSSTRIPVSQQTHNSLTKSIINPFDTFATLSETLRLVPPEVGFVIEIKYPSERFQHSSKMRYHERNDYVDAVLKCVFNALGNTEISSRKIMLISFDPDICVLLSQKQPRYPVFFLLALGHGIPVGPDDDEIEGYDPRCQSIEMAVKFAKNVRLQGIICDAGSVLNDISIVTKTHEANLLLMTYGSQNMDESDRNFQKNAGVDSLIMDNVMHINRYIRRRSQMSSMFVADYGRQKFKLASPTN